MNSPEYISQHDFVSQQTLLPTASHAGPFYAQQTFVGCVESVTQLPDNWIVFQNNKMSINKQPIIHFTEEVPHWLLLSWWGGGICCSSAELSLFIIRLFVCLFIYLFRLFPINFAFKYFNYEASALIPSGGESSLRGGSIRDRGKYGGQ